jgi:phage regulator Rha-like protein
VLHLLACAAAAAAAAAAALRACRLTVRQGAHGEELLRYLFSALFIAAFEELEKALSTAQKTEDAQRRMKMEMDEQMKAVERASEEERLRLQHELSRVRQEAASMAKVRTA